MPQTVAGSVNNLVGIIRFAGPCSLLLGTWRMMGIIRWPSDSSSIRVGLMSGEAGNGRAGRILGARISQSFARP
jgi:hypothetical protein